MKGKAEPVTVYRLVAARARPQQVRAEIGPISSPLVGRDAEVEQVSADLGLLCRVKGRREEAQRLFDEAMNLATPLGAPALVERIEAARSTLV